MELLGSSDVFPSSDHLHTNIFPPARASNPTDQELHVAMRIIEVMVGGLLARARKLAHYFAPQIVHAGVVSHHALVVEHVVGLEHVVERQSLAYDSVRGRTPQPLSSRPSWVCHYAPY